MRIIEVVVSPQGETLIQTQGYIGAECMQASQWLEQALGIPVTDRKTSEFFQTAEQQQHVEQ